jgi:hypothetical protein
MGVKNLMRKIPIAARLGPFVAVRMAQDVRLDIQKRVERLLDRPPHHLVEVRTNLLLVNLDDSRQFS